MSETGWECIRVIGLALVGAFVTLGSAYIAARWSVTKKNNKNNSTDNNGSK